MELPHIEKFYRELKSQGFGLITVTKDDAPSVLRMVEYHGITHPIVSDTTNPASGQVFEKYNAYDGKHYLLSSDGKILATFSKLGISLPILRRELAKHGIGETDGSREPQSSSAASPSDGPVAWKISAKPVSTKPGAAVNVTLAATIEPGWHIYAITQGAGGPTPLRIELPKGQPFTLAGEIGATPPQEKFDPNFGIDVQHHADRAEFQLPVAVANSAKPGKQTVKVETRYQACNARICLPPQTDTLMVPVTIGK